ncbi:MAG: NAD(P)H-quinone oxidoreductase [Acidimicrobiaceae bacterium]|nr:NAD(P)H-quinone oxidoreductase [Acidimicrobiaceae bacterium]MBT5850802.1 NAD(P)H-quinone oxidoreductase [Acidimicrobiaceae bacterium]
MRAVVLEEKGGPEVLQIKEVPDPVAGPDEVLVQIVSSALNRADLLQRMGLYPGPAMEHEILGLEFAGRVVAVGDRVTEHANGDAVMGISNGGCYAEQIAIHERQAMSVPEVLPLSDAGAFPEVFVTAWDALVRQGGLTSGRWALVHAGASGVGTAAIQICKAMGARIAVTASAGKHDVCHQLGADVVIDYNADDFVAVTNDATEGLGIDVVLDVIGGEYTPRNVSALRLGGRIIQVGVMAGGPVPFNVASLLMKRATITGTTLRARPIEEKVAITREFAAQILPHVASGAISPVIDSRYPLDEVADAHERMASNANAGKLVLDISE